MSELKPRITENGIDYILVGDYYIPGLKLPEEHRPIGKYGRMHREYLREVHPARLNTLILTGELLTYGEDTEIHIAGEIDMKKLAWLSVEDYGTTVMEIIVASAMKGYLRRMSEKEALKKVESIIDPKVIQLFGEGGAPMPVQSHVDGAKFAAFIDEAVADSIRGLEVREDDMQKFSFCRMN